MGKARRPASLNGIYFDAIISRDRNYTADVPEYPVESGFSVSDAVLNQPMQLNVTAFISNTPVTWKRQLGNTRGRVDRVLRQLENLYFSKSIVTLTTSGRTYSSMAITSLTIPETAEMTSAVEVQLTLKQVRVTRAKTTTIPASYGMSGTTGASGGTASTETKKEGSFLDKACSILYGLFKK